MKRLSKIVMLLLAVFLITGCVRRKVHMDISRSGDIELSAIIAYASSTGMSVTDSEREAYKKYGFTVEEYSEDDYNGVRLTKKYKLSEVSSESSVTLSLSDLLESDKPIMFQKVGNTYKANFILDATESGSEGSGADISYSVTLPNKPISHNADTVDKNTLTWTVDLGGVKNINYEFSLGGIPTLWIIIAIVGVAAVAIIIVIVVMSKKNHSTPTQPTDMNGMTMNSGLNQMPNPTSSASFADSNVAAQTPVIPVADNVAPVVTESTLQAEVTGTAVPMVEPTPVITESPSVAVEADVTVNAVTEPTSVGVEANPVAPIADEIMPAESATVEPVVAETVQENVSVGENQVVESPVLEASIEEKQPTDAQ